MLLNQDYATPAELTGYVRAAQADLEPNQFRLGQWLPNRQVADIEFRFARGGQGLVEAATFRQYDTPAPTADRQGVVRVTGELPPISRKMRLSEEDLLRLRGMPDDEVTSQAERDALALMRQVAARLELARGEALYSGKIVLAENGVVATVDFDRAAGHTGVAPAGATWDTVATAVPLADELAWIDTYVATNGEPPGAAVCSTTVLGYLLRNQEYREIAGSTLGTPTRISRAQLDGIRADNGLPPIVVVDEQVKVNGVATRVIPNDRFLLLPAPNPDPETNEFGGTLYGVTAEATEFEGLEGMDEAGIVAAMYKTDDPVAHWTKAAAIALPVVANPDLSFEAVVA